MDLITLNTLLIDGDGVLWRSGTPVPGLARFFDVLARCGIHWALVTNNSTRTRDEHLAKLHSFGIKARPEQVYSSAVATAAYLKTRFAPGAVIYVVGEQGLVETLRTAGFTVYAGHNMVSRADAVVAGMDRELDSTRLTTGMRLIRAGAAFIATNTDRTFPTPDGLIPGAGTVVAALEAASDVKATVIGKPERAIFDAAIAGLGAERDTTAMLGDRLETDIVGGKNAGIGTIAVLTGVTTREQFAASPVQPDLIFESIAELADALEHARL